MVRSDGIPECHGGIGSNGIVAAACFFTIFARMHASQWSFFGKWVSKCRRDLASAGALGIACLHVSGFRSSPSSEEKGFRGDGRWDRLGVRAPESGGVPATRCLRGICEDRAPDRGITGQGRGGRRSGSTLTPGRLAVPNVGHARAHVANGLLATGLDEVRGL